MRLRIRRNHLSVEIRTTEPEPAPEPEGLPVVGYDLAAGDSFGGMPSSGEACRRLSRRLRLASFTPLLDGNPAHTGRPSVATVRFARLPIDPETIQRGRIAEADITRRMAIPTFDLPWDDFVQARIAQRTREYLDRREALGYSAGGAVNAENTEGATSVTGGAVPERAGEQPAAPESEPTWATLCGLLASIVQRIT